MVRTNRPLVKHPKAVKASAAKSFQAFANGRVIEVEGYSIIGFKLRD